MRGLGAAGLAVLLAAGFVVDAAALGGRPGGPVLILVTAGIAGAALLRRRFPARAAAVAIGLGLAGELIDWRTARVGQPSPTAGLALLIVVASVIRSLPSAAGAVAVAAGSGVVAAGTLERYAGTPHARTATLIMVTGWAVAVVAGGWRRFADVRRRAAAAEVRRGERLALARDLHDIAAHHLTGLIIQTQVAQLDAGPGRAALAEIEAAGAGALTALRQVVRLLRDDEPAPAPPTLAELVDDFNASDRPGTARLDLPDGPPPAGWPVDVTTGLHRIAQEALTNVSRHARGPRTVVVSLAHDEREVRLRVTDDGERVPAAPDGHGLTGMRERAAALGGRLAAGPGDPAGWLVEAVLPAPDPA